MITDITDCRRPIPCRSSMPAGPRTPEDSRMPSSVSLVASPVRRERAAAVPGRPGTRERMVRRRRRLARLCLGWAALSLLSELTPLGYWLNTTLPVYWYAVTWLAAGAPSVGFAVLLGVLSSGLRRGRAMAFWLVAICLALAGPLGFLAGSSPEAGCHPGRCRRGSGSRSPSTWACSGCC